MFKVPSRDFPQIIAVLLACLGTLTLGITFSWPSPSIQILTSDEYPLKITLEDASYFAVIPPIVTILAGYPCSMMVDILGRKKSVIFIAVPQTLCWILVIISNSLWTFYAARVCVGIADALCFAALPVYIGEVATPSIRGSWGNAMTLSICLGALLMNAIGSYCSIATTGCILICIPIIFAASFLYMPESPYFLLMNKRMNEARVSLKWLRNSEDVEVELEEISKAIQRQMCETGTFKDLFCKSNNRRALIVGLFLRFTQQYSGIPGFQAYSQRLFMEAGSNLSPAVSAIIFQAAMAFFTLWAAVFLDVLGRRKSTLISGIGCAFLLFLMGTYLYLNTFMELSGFTWFPIVGMVVYIIFFSIGFCMVPTLMLGELFSNSVKSKALTVLTSAFGAFVASSTKLFQVFMSEFGLYSSFYFYMSCCLVGTIICYIIIPETKGKTLDEIQLGFQKKLKPEKEVSLPN